MTTLLTLAKADTGPLVVTVSRTKLGATGLLPYHSGTGKLWFYGKYDVSDSDTLTTGLTAGVVFKKDLTSGVSVTTDGDNVSVDGVVAVTLAPADTSVIPYDLPVTLYCALKGYDGTNEYTFLNCWLLVTPYATSKVS